MYLVLIFPSITVCLSSILLLFSHPFVFRVVKAMSWLSDHLFGVPKTKDENTKDADGNASVESSEQPPPPSEDGAAPAEIQNTAITTSANDASAEDAATAYENRDVVAEWQVPVRGKLHQLEFEHGTTSGKRILWVNGQVSSIRCYDLVVCSFALMGFSQISFAVFISYRKFSIVIGCSNWLVMIHSNWMA